MHVSSYLLNRDADLRRILSVLDRCEMKICVVVDDEGRVLRTVTDGDVRRALLAGHSLTTPVSEIENTRPMVTRPEGTDPVQIARAMQEEAVDVIVLLDAHGRPTQLVPRSEVLGALLLSPPHMGAAEAAYVQQAFDENWVAPAGPNLNEFERALCEVSGRAHALALSSATAGLHLALRVLDIGQGDRVYVSDLTFVASVQPILYERAEPVLIDAEPISWNMSPLALERALSRDARAGMLPKAIIVVHLYGQSADLAAIMALADHYCIPVIEDAAESLGATYGDRPSGSHGVLSVYSFNGNKIITTSGGGALLSDREDLIARARFLSTQGRNPAPHYQHDQIAYNYRMSNVLAGIGRGQLEVLPERVTARRRIFARYAAAFSDIPGLSFQRELPDSTSNRWLTVISLDPDVVGIHPYQVIRALQARRMESRPAWKPMQMQPLLKGATIEPHQKCAMIGPKIFLTSLCLPSGSAMTEAAQDEVIDVVRSTLAGAMAV